MTITLVPKGTPNLWWRLLARPGIRRIIVRVCVRMEDLAFKEHGQPAVISTGGIIGLWRSAYVYSDWKELRLEHGDPVFVMHVFGSKLSPRLFAGENWRGVIRSEFKSLAPQLRNRQETAIVGTAILRRQIEEFGGKTRNLPRSLHLALDTFYRHLILLAFHPGGVKRVVRHGLQPVVEGAIPLQEFCRRFG